MQNSKRMMNLCYKCQNRTKINSDLKLKPKRQSLISNSIKKSNVKRGWLFYAKSNKGVMILCVKLKTGGDFMQKQ